MRRVREDRQLLGSFADVPDMWRDPLLRQLAEPTREQTRPRHGTPGDRIRAAGRAVVVLLSGRCVRGILNWKL